MKIIFMGTPDFARDSLDAIYNAGHEIAAVITVPDKPKGRGMKLIPCEVKEYATQKGFPIYQPEKLRDNQEIVDLITKINPDILCVVAYGKIIPNNILEIPKYGAINVHPSLLPKYRGSAPIQWAILNGDEKTGVTIMHLNEEMDAGDIILQKEVDIDKNETSGELWDRLSKIGADLLVQSLEQIENGTAKRKEQGNNFTIAPMLNKEIAKIDWENKTAKEIKNLVRGLNPIMGAYAFLNGKKIKFWKVAVATDEEIVTENMDFIQNGTVLLSNPKDGLFIKTKEGILKVIEIQGENAKRMPIQDFLRGNNIEEFEVFE